MIAGYAWYVVLTVSGGKSAPQSSETNASASGWACDEGVLLSQN